MSTSLVLQECGDAQFTLAEHERPQVGHARVGEHTVRHGLCVVAADHERDLRGEIGRDPGGHLVGGGEQVHGRPPGSSGVDDARCLRDAETVGFGVEDAYVETADFLGVRSDVRHAQHGQRVVVGPGPQPVVAQRCVHEQCVESSGRIGTVDQG